MAEATTEPGVPANATPGAGFPAADGAQTPSSGRTSSRRRLPSRELLALVAAAVFLLVIVAGIAITTLGYRSRYEQGGRILPNVVVMLRTGSVQEPVDLGGLLPAEAAARLEVAFDGFDNGGIALALPSETVVIPNREIGRSIDIDSMVATAFAVGRGPTWSDGIWGTLSSMLDRVVVEPAIRLDQARLKAAVERVQREVTLAPTNASVALDGTSFVMRRGGNGRTIESRAVLDALQPALGASPTLPFVSVTVDYVAIPPRITNGDANRARADANAIAGAAVVLTGAGQTWTFGPDSIVSWIRVHWDENDGLVVTTDAAATAATLAPVASAVASSPRDAAFLRDRRGNAVGVIAGADGTALDAEATAADVTRVLEARTALAPLDEVHVAELPVKLTVTHPTLTTEEAAKTAPVMELVGQWTTNYVVSAHNGYGANITVPIRLINGQTVKPGATFNFWSAVGPVTYANGYRLGGAIINGHSVEGTTLGGGICSASTTVFNAAVRAGYQILERWNHYYYITRYPLGLDATVYGSASGGQNMRFRNDTPNTLVFRTTWGYGWVHVEIWTVPNGRTTTFSSPVVKNVRKAIDTTVYTSALKKGTSVRLEWPANGMDVWVTRTVTDASGAVIRRDTFFSDYAKMDGILQVGTG